MASPVEFTWEQKVYIVRAFAIPRTVNSILDTMEMIYKVRCKADDLLQFDPQYRTLPPDLHRVFVEAKKAFEEDPAKVVPLISPLRQQVVLATTIEDELRRNAIPSAAKLLEQLAKLQGGFFSGKTTKGDDGKNEGPMSFTFNLDKANAKPD